MSYCFILVRIFTLFDQGLEVIRGHNQNLTFRLSSSALLLPSSLLTSLVSIILKLIILLRCDMMDWILYFSLPVLLPYLSSLNLVCTEIILKMKSKYPGSRKWNLNSTPTFKNINIFRSPYNIAPGLARSFFTVIEGVITGKIGGK